MQPEDEGGDDPEIAPAAISNLQRALRAGVTGVRVLGETDDIDVTLSRATSSGSIVGPRVLPSGLTLHTTGGHGHAYPREYLRMRYFDVVDGPTEVTRSVRGHVQRGAQWIKLCLTGGLFSEHEAVDEEQFDDGELRAAMAAARGRGVPVAAHCGSPRVAERFAALGGRSVEHGYAIDEASAHAMAQAGTWLVPTIAVTHDEQMMIDDGWPPHAIARALESAKAHAEALRACIDADVRIAVGADLNPLATRIHREIQLLESAGMTRLQVLSAATAGGRELNGFGGGGAPEPGDLADLVAVRRHPLDDMATLRDPTVVTVSGRVLSLDRPTA